MIGLPQIQCREFHARVVDRKPGRRHWASPGRHPYTLTERQQLQVALISDTAIAVQLWGKPCDGPTASNGKSNCATCISCLRWSNPEAWGARAILPWSGNERSRMNDRAGASLGGWRAPLGLSAGANTNRGAVAPRCEPGYTLNCREGSKTGSVAKSNIRANVQR